MTGKQIYGKQNLEKKQKLANKYMARKKLAKNNQKLAVKFIANKTTNHFI